MMCRRIWAFAIAMGLASASAAQAKAEQCRAAVTRPVAVPSTDGVLISWRFEPCTRNRSITIFKNGRAIARPRNASSWFDRSGTSADIYAWGRVNDKIPVLAQGYLNIALSRPVGRVTPSGETYDYSANDGAIGDVDGDGTPEILLKWTPSIAKDNAFGGYTGETLIDAYRLDGTQLWRIDLGPNIRSGAHYTQMVFADFDGNGKAELMLKTADGTIDGTGKTMGDPKADWRQSEGLVEQRDRTGSTTTPDGRLLQSLIGRIVSGPEYLTVFDGLSGKAVATTDYLPARLPKTAGYDPEALKAVWGDAYANRSERYLAGAAWLDGKLPSAIFARGYYARTVVAAWDFRGGKLTSRWVFDSATPGQEAAGGQGNHQLSVADVDADGQDEIVYGSLAIDDTGALLWNAGMRHGDALHVGELDPENPGLERFGVHEEVKGNGGIGAAMLDARTGRVLWTSTADKDTGRGLCADIDARHPGAECWSSNEPVLRNARGMIIAERRPRIANFALYWDGDPLRELLDGTRISKWNAQTTSEAMLFDIAGACSNNGTKATPVFSGDILGDWREEVVLKSCDERNLRIYVSPIPTGLTLPPLDTDPTYARGLIWQNGAYNQPPHLGQSLQTLGSSLKRRNRRRH